MASIQPAANSPVQPIDLDECLKDSPKFRHLLKENLSYIDRLEACMEKTVKHCNQSIESGKSYLKTQSAFVGSLTDLSECFKDDREISVRLDTLLVAFREIIRLQTIIVDQAGRTIGSGISKFIQDDLSKLKDTRKSFEKISHENDQILTRCSQPLKKQGDDSENLLIATSTAFRHTSLDLSIQLTTLQCRKGYEVLDSVLSFTKAYGTFFHQGSDLFDDLKPYISATNDLLTKRQDICESLVRSLPSKHLMVSSRDIKPPTFKFDTNEDRVHLEGYLFKRASNAFKVWNRRWFILEDHQLLYQKRGDIHPTVMEEDLRLCTVRLVDKPDIERRFCFEVLSPQKNHILQADSDEACQMWISTIQAGINAAYHDVNHHYTNNPAVVNQKTGVSRDVLNQKMTQSASQDSFKTENSVPGLDQSASSSSEPSSTSGSFRAQQNDLPHNLDNYIINGKFLASTENIRATTNQAFNTNTTNVNAPLKPQRAYSRILALPGNEQCCDCGCPEPKWASINLGITLCIECSGIHRSLGVHVSKVRSLTLDTDVWSPETVQLMVSLGNVRINSIYLEKLEGEQRNLISPTSSRQERETWIREKYLTKRFIRNQPRETELQEQSDPSASTESNNVDTIKNQSEHTNIFNNARSTLNESMNNETFYTANESQISDAQMTATTNDIMKINACSTDSNKGLLHSSDTEENSLYQNLKFYESTKSGDLISMSECLALGAKINWINGSDVGRTALHHAAINGSSTVIIEYLLINGWQVNTQDYEGNTPLHLATSAGNTSHVCQFLKRGADQSLTDKEGRDAVSLAVDSANADIVTLLRLAKLNDEMRRDESGCIQEETVDYYVDFADTTKTNIPKTIANTIPNMTNRRGVLLQNSTYMSVPTHTDDDIDNDTDERQISPSVT